MKQANCPLVAQPSRTGYPLNGLKTVSMASPSGQKKKENEMKFTVKELLQAGSHKWQEKDVDAVTLRNLEDLCRKVNQLCYEPPMYASSCLRSLADQKRINPKALGSSHLYGCAVDIADKNGRLALWLLSDIRRLEARGLWMEDPQYTKGWVHLQTYAPKSLNRVFIP